MEGTRCRASPWPQNFPIENGNFSMRQRSQTEQRHRLPEQCEKQAERVCPTQAWIPLVSFSRPTETLQSGALPPTLVGPKKIDSVTHLVSLTARGHAATRRQSTFCVLVLKLYRVSPAEPCCVCVALKPGMSIASMGSDRDSPSVGLKPQGSQAPKRLPGAGP